MSGIAIPRGIRNNNPGNIRRNATPWVGLAAEQNDPDFFVFTDAVYGLRAIFRVLHSYAMQDRTTIRQWIEAWAPPEDGNDTEAYIAAVAGDVGISADAPISPTNFRAASAAVRAIVHEENGEQPYGPAVIAKAFTLAYPVQPHE